MNNNIKINNPKKLMVALVFVLAFVFYLTLALNYAKAQTTTTTNNLGTETVNAVQEYQPTITNANKITDVPAFKDSAPALPKLSYKILPKDYPIIVQLDELKAATVKGESLTKLYRSLFKLGYGNYNTPYVEYFYNNLRSKKLNWGLHYKHLSSSGTMAGVAFPGISDDNSSFNLKYLLKEYTLTSNAYFNRNAVHYYGYNLNYRNDLQDVFPTVTQRPDTSLNKNDIFQRFLTWGVSSELASNFHDPKSHYNSTTSLHYNGITDNYGMIENSVKVATKIGHSYENEYLYANVSLDYYNNKNTIITEDNLILTINPKALFDGKKWHLDVGAKIVPVFAKENKTYFYPDVDFSYSLADKYIAFYAGATGSLYRNSFRSLTDQNPFVITTSSLQNTSNTIQLYGGFKGMVSTTTSYVIGVTYNQYKNYALFSNFNTNYLGNQFNVIYDDVNVLAASAEVSHQTTEKIILGAKGTYYNYQTANELKAWYKPDVQATVFGKYNLQDKLIAKLDVFYLNNQYAKTTVYDTLGVPSVNAQKLNNFIDVNLGFEYRYTKRLSGFVNFNNIGSSRYYRWNNYPTQRFNFLLGITYAL